MLFVSGEAKNSSFGLRLDALLAPSLLLVEVDCDECPVLEVDTDLAVVRVQKDADDVVGPLKVESALRVQQVLVPVTEREVLLPDAR